MKKLIIGALILSMIFSLMACGQVVPPINQGNNISPVPTEQSNILTEIKVFYGDEFNENLVFEKRQISFTNVEDKYQLALVELFKGPQNTAMTRNLNANIKIYGVIKQDDSLVVDLSKEFVDFAGEMAEILGVASIVNTLTQFAEIKSVKILVEGNELIGLNDMPRGFMKEVTKVTSLTKIVTLYFSDKNATNLVKEQRQLSVGVKISNEELARLVLNEQIIGTKNKDLNNTLNSKIKILSVAIKGDLSTIDFSKELLDSCQGTTGETFAIDTIVNILTDIPGIKRVLIKLEGKTLETGHNIYDKPITR